MPRKHPIRFYLLFVLLVLAQARGFALGVEDFQARTYKDANGRTLNYRLFVPKKYKPGEKYPLILFLHGSGERGGDNQKQVGYFGASVFADDFTQTAHPCFLVAPQCPDGDSWAKINGTKQDVEFAAQPTEPMRLTMETLTALQKEFSIDPKRLYITGLSMGGYGTWDAIARYPKLFAAAVPICGGGDPAIAKRLVETPIWGFHGAADPTVPPARSRHMMIALREAGGGMTLTEYPGVGHNSWEKAYRDQIMANWMFALRLPMPPRNPKAVKEKPMLAGRESFSGAGLIAVWRASERNDGALRDLSKSHNDLTLVNGQMALQENNVLNFSDAQPILTFDPAPGLEINKAFTLAAWFRVDPGHYEPETLFTLATAEGAKSFAVSLNETHRLQWDFIKSTRRSGNDWPFDPRDWHHVAVTYSGNTIQKFVDGLSAGRVNEGFLIKGQYHAYFRFEDGSEAKLSEIFHTLQIGGEAQGKNPFFGKMDDIRLYNRALTAAEIANLAGVKLPATRPPPK